MNHTLLFSTRILLLCLFLIEKTSFASSLINRLPNIDLMPKSLTKDPTESELKFYEAKRQAIIQSNALKALEIILEGVKKHQDSFILKSSLATVVGDIYEGSADQEALKYSKRLFDKLAQEVKYQPLKWNAIFRNEYYYRSALYEDQYNLGIELELKFQNEEIYPLRLAYYAQGVGSANCAYDLLKKGFKDKAVVWAKKSVVAWEKYLKIYSYYNAYVHYSLALGILGDVKKMNEIMLQGAALVKSTPDNHPEFVDVKKKLAQVL